MQSAMVEKNGSWTKGFTDYVKREAGEVFTDYVFGDTAKVVVTAEEVKSPNGDNYFYTLRNATSDEIAEANSGSEEVSFGGFFDILAD